jgi:glycerol-3-phosphate dehydrogenase (NAD(P)+)
MARMAVQPFCRRNLMPSSHPAIAVLGGGSFGTAMGVAAARSGNRVSLICRTELQAELIRETRKNSSYFPDVEISPLVTASSDVNLCLEADIVFIAIPARFIDEYLEIIVKRMKPGSMVVNLVKGLDSKYLTFAEHFQENASGVEYVALKGPTFARPLLLGELSGLTIGAQSEEAERRLRAVFAGTSLDFDASRSPASVDMVSALKNVYAIILGVVASLNMSDNTRFMIITRIIAEAREVVDSLGMDGSVISKYCGVGDILLTGMCDTSRNRTLGVMIGKGIPVDANRPDFLAEGVRSVRIMLKHLTPGVAPLIEYLAKVLDGKSTPGLMIEEIIHRR